MKQQYNRKPLIKTMTACIVVPLVLFVIFLILYKTMGLHIFKILYITFLVILYHFAIRLLIGEYFNVKYKNKKFDYNSDFFKIGKLEKRFYKLIKIKSWKNNMITAIPDQFDIKKNTIDEILHNMAVGEYVHIASMLASFVPLLLIFVYGSPAVFIITSVLACIGDSLFTMMQRYNLDRIIPIKDKLQKRINKTKKNGNLEKE